MNPSTGATGVARERETCRARVTTRKCAIGGLRSWNAEKSIAPRSALCGAACGRRTGAHVLGPPRRHVLPALRRRSPRCGLALIVRLDNLLHQIVTDHVALVEIDKRDAFDIPHHVDRFN